MRERKRELTVNFQTLTIYVSCQWPICVISHLSCCSCCCSVSCHFLSSYSCSLKSYFYCRNLKFFTLNKKICFQSYFTSGLLLRIRVMNNEVVHFLVLCWHFRKIIQCSSALANYKLPFNLLFKWEHLTSLFHLSFKYFRKKNSVDYASVTNY